MSKKVLGVIPARYRSERLPGKPLRMIGDKPMIRHTYESAKRSRLLNDLIVLTDDEKIFNAVKQFGGDAAMTPGDLKSGTDRAAYFLRENPGYDIIVNIQGDEPFIKGGNIDASVTPLISEHSADVVTLATDFKNTADVINPAYVKVVCDPSGFALYFSRSPVPYYRDEQMRKEYLKHIGLYTYTNDALLRLSELPVSRLESIEKLEQLRMLENHFVVQVVKVEDESISVDTEEDLIRANEYYSLIKK